MILKITLILSIIIASYIVIKQMLNDRSWKVDELKLLCIPKPLNNFSTYQDYLELTQFSNEKAQAQRAMTEKDTELQFNDFKRTYQDEIEAQMGCIGQGRLRSLYGYK